ncbi:MAG TPA: glycosyltransferase family 2 protein [Steroidobacteraceae bacterium]|nr:glycosyltransferase family 2 protein [Steroidobacteraceae bacterium]
MPKSVALLVSIITIVRNDSPGLSRTRASIAAQVGVSDFEWVVVDGASTDGTAQLALGLDEAYAWAVSEPDKGIFDAMNKGLARAAGAFVLFLNAGDSFANVDVLSRVSKILSSNTIDFLYGDSLEAFAGDRLSYKVAQGHDRLHYGMFACHQSMYYRRSLIGDQRYDPRFRIAGDYCFTAQFLLKNPRVLRLHEALCVFDLTGASVVNKRRGREENWVIQRDVLRLSLPRRLIIRGAYLVSALLSGRFPKFYKMLRFRKSYGY